MGYRVKLPPIRTRGEKDIDGSTITKKLVTVVTLVTESPAPLPVTPQEKQADLDAEEALFRVYWRTLPDKALARRTWPSEVRWYCGQKDLNGWVEEELVWRCEDLVEGKR